MKSLPARVLALALAMQSVAYYALASRSEIMPEVSPLSVFPSRIGSWDMVRDFPIEKETQDVLRADDTLSREYAGDARQSVALFVAFFKTQRFGQSPHSPKNCLPGSGWQPTEDTKISISVAGRAPIVVNKYVVERGDNKSVVLYWYQSHNRVIASEFTAKFWLVADAIRYRRSDTALVRVIVPASGGTTQATEIATKFVSDAFPHLERQFGN
jgi:EpsI family protein